MKARTNIFNQIELYEETYCGERILAEMSLSRIHGLLTEISKSVKSIEYDLGEKICINCGKIFKTNKKKRKYCDYDCGIQYRESGPMWRKDASKKMYADGVPIEEIIVKFREVSPHTIIDWTEAKIPRGLDERVKKLIEKNKEKSK